MDSNKKHASATIYLKTSNRYVSVDREVINCSLKETFADLFKWVNEGKHDSVFELHAYPGSEVFLISFHALAFIQLNFKD